MGLDDARIGRLTVRRSEDPQTSECPFKTGVAASPDTACTCDRGPSLVGELDQACLLSGSAADRSGTVRAATGAEGWRRGRWCPSGTLGGRPLDCCRFTLSGDQTANREGAETQPSRPIGCLVGCPLRGSGVGTDYVIDSACDLQLPQQLPPGPTVGAPQLQAPPDA